MPSDRFTPEQIGQIRKIEDLRAAKGLPGYKDFFEEIKLRLMEREGVTSDDFENFNEDTEEDVDGDVDNGAGSDDIEEPPASNQYANEEVHSYHTYPKEYKGPKPIVDQIKAIAKIFDLDPSHAIEFVKQLPALPEGAEGWFAIPSVDALAKKHFPRVTDPAEMYCHAVRLVYTQILASRSFYNYHKGEITPALLRVHARTAHALDLITETQKGDILIVAAQLGLRHRGKSVLRAREVFVGNEFGLGSLAVGSIVLVHPERLVRSGELDMDCSGDGFSPEVDGVFSESPYFCFSYGKVGFSIHFVDNPHVNFGSVSGFLSQ